MTKTERLIHKEQLKLNDLANEKRAVAKGWVERARRIRARMATIARGDGK